MHFNWLRELSALWSLSLEKQISSSPKKSDVLILEEWRCSRKNQRSMIYDSFPRIFWNKTKKKANFLGWAGLREGFPCGASGKEPSANAGDVKDAGLILQFGRSPGGGHGYPLENSMDREAWKCMVIGSQRVRYNWSNLAHMPYIIFLNLDLIYNRRTVKENGKHGEKRMNGIFSPYILLCPF